MTKLLSRIERNSVNRMKALLLGTEVIAHIEFDPYSRAICVMHGYDMVEFWDNLTHAESVPLERMISEAYGSQIKWFGPRNRRQYDTQQRHKQAEAERRKNQ